MDTTDTVQAPEAEERAAPATARREIDHDGHRFTIHHDAPDRFDVVGRSLQELGDGIAETLADAVVGIERRLDAIAAQLARTLHPSLLATGAGGAERGGGERGGRALMPPPPPPAEPRPAVSGQERATFAFADGWHGWEGRFGAVPETGGAVALPSDMGGDAAGNLGGQPGIVSPTIALPGGGLFRVVVTVAGGEPPDSGLTLTVTDDGPRPVGPPRDLQPGITEATFFVSRRTERLRLLVTVPRPRPGIRFRIEAVRVEALDPDSHHAAERAGRSQPVLASLASIPSREVMLRDCVDSLLVQCDRVRVFLNGYPDVPPFLDHPRVEVRRSQDWDDKGDAGKFFWVDEPDEPGYRVIADDDLLFPPDFAAVMTRKVASYGNRAVVGLHGVLLKQPVTRYYDPASRSVLYFEAALADDRTVHVLGTNALCYHSGALRMRWADFMHRNMADIFLARHAQENGLPMVAPARPWLWVRQNSQPGGADTIYEHSLKRTRTRFDSSAVQDAVVKAIAPLTLQPTGRTKLVVCLCATAADRLRDILDWWRQARPAETDRVVVVADGTVDDGIAQDLAQLRLDDELHIVRRGTPAAALLAALDLVRRIGGDEVLVLTDGLRLSDPHWYSRLATVRTIGGHALIGLAVADADPREAAPREAVGGPRRGADLLAPGTALWFGRRQPSPAPIGPAASLDEALAAVFGADPLNPDQPADAASPPVPPAPGGLPPVAARLLGTDLATLAAAGPVEPPVQHARWAPGPPCPPLGVNEMFERVLLLNLDRRPDRLAAAQRRLERAGIRAQRFRAVDGAWPEIRAEYLEYLRTPILGWPADVRHIPENFEFFNDYDSQTARAAFVERRDRRKAIQSPGAWGYLRSMERILEDALKDGVASLLVLDDDVLFHRRARELFAATASHLPPDWLVFQLGTLQYHWEEPWMRWAGPLLYRSHGAAVGSHAVGVRFDLLPFLLEQTRRRELPYDTGALSAALHAFPDRNYIACPNIVIQSLGDSDIRSSVFQRDNGPEIAARTYRWVLEDYER